MANYKAPGVYVEDITGGSQNIEQVSSSVGLMIGYTKSGLINQAQKITSWTEFISKYANGLDTPFDENSYLAYSVYGFFNNGGSELYVGSIKNAKAKKATITSTTNKITATASSEGVWGNKLKVALTKTNSTETPITESTEFDVTVTLGNESVTVSGVTVANFGDLINNLRIKNWLSVLSLDKSTVKLAEETSTLTGGTDGDALTDDDYVNALTMADFLDDVTMVAIPGQTNNKVMTGLISYCEENNLFPILDAPMGSSVEEVRAYVKPVSAWTGSLVYPWGKINDPLTGNLKLVPTAGYAMGVYARTFESEGIHKAPAGVDAVINGFVELETRLKASDVGTLNSNGVVCVCARPNVGIVLWGARSLNKSDTTMRYITDGIMNLTIKKSIYEGTQFAVFEANDETLWKKVESSCKAFLENLRLNGSLKGTQEEAYYVTVDASNNTEETIADGQLNIEIGYAPVKPAEFVIIKLAHSINTPVIS